ncbi:hypothetical protein [Vibrio panuliri]|uniref:Uncharacterized protein n=1 Tax=Vibrio panuliri TaxID=1381081 RepID=A0ABX3FF46_9VIBR|nr:hypothetical protein [Vibrio panuliri]KAB1457396.1 hypothetical protein F7O85_06545 [Vibrio panuliri]OLQ91442.1 hypothetical protein BIY20_01135 [Vibrio panuliri]
MKHFNKESIQRDIKALEQTDALAEAINAEVAKMKDVDVQSIIKRALPMIMSGKFSLEKIGLPSNLIQQLEAYESLNAVARKKLRERLDADLATLGAAEVVNHG